MKTNPSILVKVEKTLLSMIWSLARTPKRSAAKRVNGIPFHTVLFVTVRGKIIDDTPRISKVLKMLLPTMLPIAMAVFPLMLAIILTKNSGADVPKATTVNPIARSETFNLRAIDVAPSTRKSAPLIIKINPMSRSP